ncbi:PREDICTED: acidic leucine-rich nuclear phosphoprotein 32-related protein [Nicotiana attenuata]|uniref:Acidic leucine-rich nuclear phosphoprotein 32-related protein n=1 Tax=Nicotiana attenuata TaxID=49451 RepID=A0A314KIQ8_NICAT|nr:PREDICTED: acidic leucine-rich nuclear phosphoprotein 32-related protein [Nicotiana attenuata]OIT29080.1 acidic leucine-rich nuclear phosphoprotein 32-related protein [Nicotiana attenuata]
MDEIWERAVETALDGERNFGSVRTLTLDGAVKCIHGKLPPPSIFEKFQNLEHLSIANIGVSSLEQFPRLQNLQKLILSDNRIAGGLEFLVDAGLNSLRDLDLSNNRIQDIDDLRPLAELRLVSLDLYECPVTRVKDYRSRVFGLIRSLKYLDKMDAEGNERPESDDEEEDEEEDEEDDPGSGEVDGEDRPYRMNNGHRVGSEGVVDVDEDESDADEEEMEITRGINGSKHDGSSSSHHSNGFRVEAVGDGDDEEDDEDDEDEDFVEEIDEEGDEEDVVEVHEIEDSDEEEDGVEDDEDDDDDDDDDEEDEEEVDNDDGDFAEPESTGRLNSTEGEIDGHEQGEDDADEDDDGETGEEQGVEEDGDFDDEEEAEDEEEDNGNGYLVQPVGPIEVDDAEGSDMEPVNGDEDPELEEEVEDEEDDYGEVQEVPPSSSQKRKRDDDDDDGGEEDDDEEYAKSSKHR